MAGGIAVAVAGGAGGAGFRQAPVGRKARPDLVGEQPRSELSTADIPDKIVAAVVERWHTTSETFKEKCRELRGAPISATLDESAEEVVSLIVARSE